MKLVARSRPTTDQDVDHTRAWTGLWVVVCGDVAIALAAIFGVVKISNGGANVGSTVSILTSAFTAVGTMTTAYFGIRAISNTAQHSIASHPTGSSDTGDDAPSDPPR